ncbi:hypothetical protein ACFXGA_06265 [Actinosynnema sp. NPDC059335]|uniref:hypothetical protein n=1 Tax=Actinosynnema sp. NPDC059335 TaxID=3346804 RepID=UPI003672D1C4
MTAQETPYELLQRAARHVFWLAAHYNEYVHLASTTPELLLHGEPRTWWARDTIDRNASGEARRWAETMSPDIAVALGTTFQEASHRVREAKSWSEVTGGPVYELAYKILGERPD